MGQQIQRLGFYLAGFLCLLLAALKLTIEGHWSWWRVLIPWWVVLGHNALYLLVGFVWLLFADDGAAGEEVTIRQDHRSYGFGSVGSQQLDRTAGFGVFRVRQARVPGRRACGWRGRYRTGSLARRGERDDADGGGCEYN